MLAGHPFAGKSMLVAGLLRALHDGEPFLGRATSRTSAMVVTEEDDAALRQRAALLGLLGLKSEYVSRSGGALSISWPELVAVVTEHAVRGKHGLLVVDTFPGLAGLGGDEENDAGAIAERLRPLQVAGVKVGVAEAVSSGTPKGVTKAILNRASRRVVARHREKAAPRALCAQ